MQNIERQDLSPAMPAQLVQGRLEVVKDDAICEALENEGKLPERVDDTN